VSDKPPTRKKYNYQADSDWVQDNNGNWILKPAAVHRRVKGLTGAKKQNKFDQLRKLIKKENPQSTDDEN